MARTLRDLSLRFAQSHLAPSRDMDRKMERPRIFPELCHKHWFSGVSSGTRDPGLDASKCFIILVPTWQVWITIYAKLQHGAFLRLGWWHRLGGTMGAAHLRRREVDEMAFLLPRAAAFPFSKCKV